MKIQFREMQWQHLFIFIFTVKCTLLFALFTSHGRAISLFWISAPLALVSNKSSYDVAIFTGCRLAIQLYILLTFFANCASASFTVIHNRKRGNWYNTRLTRKWNPLISVVTLFAGTQSGKRCISQQEKSLYIPEWHNKNYKWVQLIRANRSTSNFNKKSSFKREFNQDFFLKRQNDRYLKDVGTEHVFYSKAHQQSILLCKGQKRYSSKFKCLAATWKWV